MSGVAGTDEQGVVGGRIPVGCGCVRRGSGPRPRRLFFRMLRGGYPGVRRVRSPGGEREAVASGPEASGVGSTAPPAGAPAWRGARRGGSRGSGLGLLLLLARRGPAD